MWPLIFADLELMINVGLLAFNADGMEGVALCGTAELHFDSSRQENSLRINNRIVLGYLHEFVSCTMKNDKDRSSRITTVPKKTSDPYDLINSSAKWLSGIISYLA